MKQFKLFGSKQNGLLVRKQVEFFKFAKVKSNSFGTDMKFYE